MNARLQIRSILPLHKVIVAIDTERPERGEILIFGPLVPGFNDLREGQIISVTESTVPIVNAAGVTVCQS